MVNTKLQPCRICGASVVWTDRRYKYIHPETITLDYNHDATPDDKYTTTITIFEDDKNTHADSNT